MRLTLRTLLAWIDQVLGPAEQRSLGDKVAASEVAPRLVTRIAEVVANPAISAPPPSGRGLADDPNTAAEFLDNVLDPARLEAFERICIESDVHLADVAGCHGILAETVRDPACIESLEPARREAALATARRLLQESSSGADTVRIDTSAPQPKDRPVVVPPPSRRTPLAAWLSAVVATLLLVGLGGLLVWTLIRPRLGGPRQVAGPAATAAVPNEPVPDKPKQDRGAEQPPIADPGGNPSPIDPRPPAVEPAIEPAVEPVAADDRPAAVPPPPQPASPSPSAAAMPAVDPPAPAPQAQALPPERSVPFGDALAIGGGAVDSSPMAADRPTAVDSPAAPVAPQAQQLVIDGGFTLVEGAVLLRPAAEQGEWLAATAAGPLTATPGPLTLLAPAWSYPIVGIRGTTMRLHPGTTATLSIDDRGLPRLALAAGRVVAASAGADLRLAVVAGGLEGVVAGPPGRPVGIEVAAADPMQGDPIAAAAIRATVHAAGQATTWRQAAADGSGRPLMGIPLELLIPEASALRWDGRDPAGAVLAAEAEPDWMRAVAPADRTLTRAAADVVAALSAAAEAAPLEVLRRQLISSRPENRMVAAATLSFLGDHAGLADLLCEDPPRELHEGQWSALEGATVPRALARGGAEAAALLEALRDRAPAGCGAELVALARGFDPGEPAVDRGARLVDDLESESIAVRRFAILRLRELVPPARRPGDDYRADRSPLLRADSVKWWREAVSQASRGGEPPAPTAAPPRRDDE